MSLDQQKIDMLLQYTPRELVDKVFQLAHFLDQMTTLQKQSRLELEAKNTEIAELKTEIALLKMMKGPSNEAPK
jgi:hypothetical protein